MEIEGTDTILHLSYSPPMVNEVSFDIMKVGNGVQQAWNGCFMAFIPYCYMCKQPLVWHSPPGADGVLFHCGQCKRKWIKDDKWVVADLKKAKQYEGGTDDS